MKEKLGPVLIVLITIGLCAFACVVRPMGGMVGEQVAAHPTGVLAALNSIFGVLVVDLVLVAGAVVATRNIRQGWEKALLPTDGQNLAESLYELPARFLRKVFGGRTEVLLPLFLTAFLFAIVATWIEFIPGFDTIGVAARVEGEAVAGVRRVASFLFISKEATGYRLIPFLSAALTNFNIPLALVLVLVSVISFYGVRDMWQKLRHDPRMKKFVKIGLIAVVILAFIGVTTALVKVVRPHIQMRAEEFQLGSLFVPSSALGVLLADLILIVGAAVATRRIRAGQEEAVIPSGLQNFVEVLYESVAGLLESVLGEKKAAKMIPLLLTFFFFILTANWVELLPGFDTIGLIEAGAHGGHHAKWIGPIALLTSQEGEYSLIPFLRGGNTDLNIPLALAIVSVFMTQVYGVQEVGWKYFLRFFNPRSFKKGFRGIIDIFVGLLEGLSEFTKIISFAFRLFGNLFAGMVLLTVITSLVPFLAPIVFYFLELFVGAVQALVFMMLTASFIVVATAGHGGEEHE